MDTTLEIIKDTFNKYNVDIGCEIEIEKNYFETIYILKTYIETKATINKIKNFINFRLNRNVEIILPYKEDSIGVKIKNAYERTPIYFKDIIETDSGLYLPLFLGLNSRNEKVIVDMINLPHLLVAGATGSGKSVGLRTIIANLIFNKTPDELKLILIDKKKVELTAFENLPHLLAPVITDDRNAMNVLCYLYEEMKARFNKLSKANNRNIEDYNSQIDSKKKLPYIVVVIDELHNLMATSKKECDFYLSQIASMSRAVGIHLILSTQRPSADVLAGTIRANIPSRLAFKVASRINSNIILDQAGAEKLYGKGDALFITPDHNEIERLQVAYTTDENIKSICDFIEGQGIKPKYDDKLMNYLEEGFE